MKRKITIYSFFIGLFLIGLFSCDDPMNTSMPNFKVTVDDNVCKVGKPVVFRFSGETDLISVYTGEKGHRYQYKDKGELIPIDDIRFSFKSQLSNMAGGKTVGRAVLVSTDFNGDYKNKDAIFSANWIDLTDKFTLASNNNITDSGILNLTDYIDKSKSFYLAFQYSHFPIPDESGAPSWRMRDLLVEGSFGDDYMLIGDVSDTYYSAGFNICDFAKGTEAESLSLIAANQIRIEGKGGPIATGNEVWAISRAINPTVAVQPVETALPIKASSDQQITEYSYTFNTVGMHSVVFVAKNTSADSYSQIAYEVKINVVK